MSTSFEQLLTDCLVALGDSAGSTWSRVNRMLPWCIEAIKTFPLLRPMRLDYVSAVSATYKIDLPADFREVISVEYPVGQTPPAYCLRKHRLDPNFMSAKVFYDVDHDYAAGSGWHLYMSDNILANVHVYVEYLANHDTDMEDSEECLISVPDEYENILIMSVMVRAYRERLSFAMQDPTAHTSVIQQLTNMVHECEAKYKQMVDDAQTRLTNSVVTSHKTVDKYDRVY